MKTTRTRRNEWNLRQRFALAEVQVGFFLRKSWHMVS
jgi:hypothetical protein